MAVQLPGSVGVPGYLSSNKSSDTSAFKQRFQAAQTGQEDTRQAVNSIYNDQMKRSDANAAASLADRDKAVDLLRGKIGVRSQASQDTYNALQTDFTDTPFTRLLQSSIASTLNNPDVISRDQISQFTARSKETASQAVQDAIRSAQTSNAQRGVQGGITQGTEQDLMLRATSDVVGQTRALEMDAAQARAQNLATAQSLGINLETERYKANSQRLQTLSQFVSAEESRDLELVMGMSEILANTVRQNPDLSGYASLVVDMQRSADDLLAARENLALLSRQLSVSEASGIRDSNLQRAQIDVTNRATEIQDKFAKSLKSLQDQFAKFDKTGGA